MSAKTYAQWGGIILLVLGVLGFVISGNPLFGLTNSDPIEDLFHIVAGAILAYFGFRGTDALAATWAMVFGVIFLVIGVVAFVPAIKTVFGLMPTGLGVIDNVIHLVYGVVGVWAGRAYKPGM